MAPIPEDEPRPPADDEGAPGKGKDPWVQAARYVELGFVLPASTVAGWLVGAALDRWLHTSWLQVVGLVLGSVGGIIDVLRTLLKNEAGGQKS